MTLALITSVKVANAQGVGDDSLHFDSTAGGGAKLLVAKVSRYSAASGYPTVPRKKGGGSFTALTPRTQSDVTTQIFYIINPTTSATDWVSIGDGSTGNYVAMEVAVYSATGTVTFVAENGAAGTSSPLSTGSVTPSSNGSLIVAGIGTNATSNTHSIGSSLTIEQQSAGGTGVSYSGAFADLVQTTAAAINPQWTSTGSPSMLAAVVAVFSDAVPAPVITGPTGSAGASSITTSAAENQNVAGVWTATNSVSWSLSGADAALLSISGGTVTKASGNFDYDLSTGGKQSYSFNVDNGSASQAVTLNITDINEPPSFIGPAIGALVLTQGVAMTPVNIAAKFTDPEGLGVTGTVVESLPSGLSVSGGVLQGTPTTLQGATSYTPRGADPAANATNGTAFTIAVVAPGAAGKPSFNYLASNRIA